MAARRQSANGPASCDMSAISRRWRALSPRSKRPYEVKAEQVSLARGALSRSGLDNAGESHLDQPENRCQLNILTPSQVKRARRNQVGSALSKIADHPAWGSGLALGDHMAALRADLVTKGIEEMTVTEVSNEVDRVFGFDRSVYENTATSEDWRVPCWTSSNGVCAKSKEHSLVKTLVHQFQSVLRAKKMDDCIPLVRLSLCPHLGSSNATPSDSQWFLLGCASYRPLGHVLIKLFQETEGVFNFAVKNMKLDIRTSHQIFLSLARQHEANTGEWNPDAIVILVSCQLDVNLFSMPHVMKLNG